MSKHTVTRSARQQKATVSRNPVTPQAVATAAKSAQPTRPIRVGDLVDHADWVGIENPGRVVAVYEHGHSQGSVVVWKDCDGNFDSHFEDEMRIIEPAKTEAPPAPITGETHRFQVGDVVTDANNETPNGIVIAVLRNPSQEDDVVVWMQSDGTCSTWYASGIELVTRGPVPDAAAAIARRRLDLDLPGVKQGANFTEADIEAAARYLQVKPVHHVGEKYDEPTLDQMREAAHTVERARQLIQQVISMTMTPLDFQGSIGWKWADEVPADWIGALLGALQNNFDDLQMAARCAIASKANDETRGAA